MQEYISNVNQKPDEAQGVLPAIIQQALAQLGQLRRTRDILAAVDAPSLKMDPTLFLPAGGVIDSARLPFQAEKRWDIHHRHDASPRSP